MKHLKYILKNAYFSLLVVTLAVTLMGCKDNTTKPEDNAPKELNTNLTDDLKLDLNYTGKVFQTDYIGEVEFVKCTDGDTFDALSNNEVISVRFHVVDTPETKVIEPWGKPASTFTCDKLSNAETIVLEGRQENMTETYGRYLAYVWYDGRLLNLELVEQAYSRVGETSDARYGSLFEQAESYARQTGKRIYGEKDPTYDYDRKYTQLTIEELRTNSSNYMGLNVEVEGIVTRRHGASAFIESNGYGIYLYLNTATSRLTEGNLVKVQGTVAEYYDQIQITGVSRMTTEVVSEDNTVVPTGITINQINKMREGSLVKISDLEITSKEPSGEAYNIYVKDANGLTTMLRFDKKVMSSFNMDLYNVGDTIDVIAPITEYRGNFQLMLCGPNDLIVKQ